MTYPYPPSTCTASTVTAISVPEQNTLAIEEYLPRWGSPRSAIAHALYRSSRAAAVRVSMSASLNWMPWNSLIALPNCRRSRAYATA